MNKFTRSEYICQTRDKDACIKYLVIAVDEEQEMYRVKRQGSNHIKEIPFRKEEDYMSTNPPDDAFIYEVGQILLKKEGTPRVGTIQEITPSAEEHLTEYEIALYTPKGQYIQTALYQQKEVEEGFEIRNLRWVVEHGNPREYVEKTLNEQIGALEREIEQKRAVRDSLVYFETEMEKSADEE